MVLLFSPTGFFEVVIFLCAIVAFLLAVRFFVESRKRLEEIVPGLLGSGKLLPFAFDRNGFVVPKTKERKPGSNSKAFHHSATDSNKDIKLLRHQLQQQQQDLAKALEQIAHLSQQSKHAESKTVFAANEKAESLQDLRLEKSTESNHLKQQQLLAEKMQERLEESQADFSKLQEKMRYMENQAWQAAELSVKLEHAEHANHRLENALAKKEERIHDLTLENQQLRTAFQEMEEKLSASNLQRKQLQKKVQFLEEFNTDMQQLAEAHQKLKTQMTRMAELESMLAIMNSGK